MGAGKALEVLAYERVHRRPVFECSAACAKQDVVVDRECKVRHRRASVARDPCYTGISQAGTAKGPVDIRPRRQRSHAEARTRADNSLVVILLFIVMAWASR